MTVKDKISLLNEKLANNNIKALIVPSNDAHFSEYVSDYDKCREYITGFDGSAGTAVISEKDSALWTDSRYFLQAEAQLENSGIELMKMGLDDTPSISQWLKTKFCTGDRIGINSKLFSIEEYKKLKDELLPCELFPTDDTFTNDIWADRPILPSEKIINLREEITGESSESKISRVREAVSLNENSIYIVSALDEIAWLCNIRGNDVNYNPVAISYCAIENERTVLFIDRSKVSDDVLAVLNEQSIFIAEYNEFDKYIKSNSEKEFILNSSKINCHILSLAENVTLENGVSIVASLKAIKNKVEINGFKQAMIEDGIALVRFNIWLEETLQSGNTTTEWEISNKLKEFRSKSELNRGISFGSIVGYKSNGAIVHYNATPESSKTVAADGFLLFDSGGQYECGTTDITRTIHLSKPNEQEKTDFTLVLKGNINLAMAIFPTNTRGSQLDILARKDMYAYGINYMHGTGHGIGHYLNVHEGPQSIRKEENSVTIKPGMVMSNEPAMYRTGEYGIRTENIIVATEHSSTEFGDFMAFETITLFPIDLKCIKIDILTTEQRSWLNNYHSKVYDILSAHLTAKEKLWLTLKTKSI